MPCKGGPWPAQSAGPHTSWDTMVTGQSCKDIWSGVTGRGSGAGSGLLATAGVCTGVLELAFSQIFVKTLSLRFSSLEEETSLFYGTYDVSAQLESDEMTHERKEGQYEKFPHPKRPCGHALIIANV